MSLKITFKNETKKTPFPKDYESLVNYVSRAFSDLPQPLKFFYLDQDSDIISVS